jgi:hypothetical protein
MVWISAGKGPRAVKGRQERSARAMGTTASTGVTRVVDHDEPAPRRPSLEEALGGRVERDLVEDGAQIREGQPGVAVGVIGVLEARGEDEITGVVARDLLHQPAVLRERRCAQGRVAEEARPDVRREDHEVELLGVGERDGVRDVARSVGRIVGRGHVAVHVSAQEQVLARDHRLALPRRGRAVRRAHRDIDRRVLERDARGQKEEERAHGVLDGVVCARDHEACVSRCGLRLRLFQEREDGACSARRDHAGA